MNLLLDTNIAVSLIRSKDFNGMFSYLKLDKSLIYISVVTEAELKSIAMQNGWGNDKRNRLDYFLDLVTITEVHEFHVDAYVEIDAYSQRRNPSVIDYLFDTPRKMGKNDLWIATLGTLLGLQLVTTDADFNHLSNIFLNVRMVNTEELKPFF